MPAGPPFFQLQSAHWSPSSFLRQCVFANDELAFVIRAIRLVLPDFQAPTQALADEEAEYQGPLLQPLQRMNYVSQAQGGDIVGSHPLVLSSCSVAPPTRLGPNRRQSFRPLALHHVMHPVAHKATDLIQPCAGTVITAQ